MERDWTINWINDRGCRPRLRRGGRRACKLDSIALDGVAIYQLYSHLPEGID